MEDPVSGRRESGKRETLQAINMDTSRDLGFPVTKDKDLVKSARDSAEDRPVNLSISPEVLSFSRQTVREWDSVMEHDLLISGTGRPMNPTPDHDRPSKGGEV